MLQSWLRVAAQQSAHLTIINTDAGNFGCDVMNVRYGGMPSGVRVCELGNNIGHGSRIGDQDGWGRAFCKGIELAITGGYDYAVHVESDMACRVDCRDVIALMEKGENPFAAPYCSQVQNIETGLIYMSVKRLKELEFVNRYNWPKIRPEMSIEERIALQPEKVIGEIFGNEWMRLDSSQGWDTRNGRMEWDSALENQLRMLIHMGQARYFTHVRPAMYDIYTRNSKGEPLPLIRL